MRGLVQALVMVSCVWCFGAERILCITDTPESSDFTYANKTGFYLYLLDYFLSPKRTLSEVFRIDQVNWLQADSSLRKLKRYRALLLWDAPSRIEDDRDNDPWYTDVDVISKDNAQKIVEFVKSGGGLVVAGGVTCYGNGHKYLSSADARRGRLRRYYGYAHSPIAEILPVEVPDSETLKPFSIRGKRKKLKVLKDTPLLAGLDFQNWGFDAYHRLKAKDGAEVLVATDDGEPLLVRWTLGRGRVLCVTASPRGNILFRGKSSPLWQREAVFWERCLRWAVKKKFLPTHKEKSLIKCYQQLISTPPEVPYKLTLEEYPYGAHMLDGTLPSNLRDLAFKYFYSLGMNAIVMQGTHLQSPQLDSFLSFYTEGLRKNNLYAFLHPDAALSARHRKVPPEKYAQLCLPSGEYAPHYGHPNPCPSSPFVTKYAVEFYDSFMPVVAKYPRIRGSFHDDEWAWNMGYRHSYEGKEGIACYCQFCKERFKKLTGLDAPPPVYREPGYVAPENDPWLKWSQTIRQDAFQEYNEAIKKAVKRIRADFILSNYPGGFEGNLDVMVEEVYLDCWRESELQTLERMDVRPNFRQDRTRSRYPLWALVGIFRMPEDKSIYPETLRLTLGLCLGGGAKAIILWNSVNLWMPYMQHPGRDPLDAEAKRIGDYIRRFGSVFLKLKKTPAPVWMLSGWFWVNSFDNYLLVPPPDPKADMERPWWSIQVAEVAVPALLRSGLYTEFVTEKQLLSEELFQKQAVVLPGLLYCREAVVKKLEEYIKRGGKVFLDQSSRVKISGAITLPLDFSKWHYDISAGKRPIKTPTEENYRKQRGLRETYVSQAIPIIRKQITSTLNLPIELDNDLATYTLMENGSTKYLFVYNADIDRPNTSRLNYTQMPRFCYDIEHSRLLNSSEKGELKLDLPPGGWKLFAFAPSRLSGLEVLNARLAGKTLTLSMKLVDSDGEIFRASVPIKIALRGEGREFVLYRSTSEGVLECQIPIEGTVPPPAELLLQELFSNRSIRIGPEKE